MINKISLYVSKQHIIIRYIVALFYFALLFGVAFLLEYGLDSKALNLNSEEKEKGQKEKLEIAKIFKSHNLTSRCKNIICSTQEIKKIARNNEYIKPYNYAQENIYPLYFSCESLHCYEFIRDIESIPNIFALRARAFNVEIILDSKMAKQQAKWRQSVFLLLEIHAIS